MEEMEMEVEFHTCSTCAYHGDCQSFMDGRKQGYLYCNCGDSEQYNKPVHHLFSCPEWEEN